MKKFSRIEIMLLLLITLQLIELIEKIAEKFF